MHIKICGITSSADARVAVAAGAAAIGMVVHRQATRAVDAEQVRAIAAALPPAVTQVLLFVDDPAEEVERWLGILPAATLQFHGAESPAFCARFAAPYIKAVRPRAVAEVEDAMAAYADARMLLLDGGAGSGEGFDWDLVPAPAARGLPVGIAGGLDPANVAAAIAKTAPDWVDVSSGVCVAGDPRRKDPQALAAFVRAAGSEVACD